jgi:hypothetical protein
MLMVKRRFAAASVGAVLGISALAPAAGGVEVPPAPAAAPREGEVQRRQRERQRRDHLRRRRALLRRRSRQLVQRRQPRRGRDPHVRGRAEPRRQQRAVASAEGPRVLRGPHSLDRVTRPERGYSLHFDDRGSCCHRLPLSRGSGRRWWRFTRRLGRTRGGGRRACGDVGSRSVVTVSAGRIRQPQRKGVVRAARRCSARCRRAGPVPGWRRLTISSHSRHSVRTKRRELGSPSVLEPGSAGS